MPAKTSENLIRFHSLAPVRLAHRKMLKGFIPAIFNKEGKQLKTLDYIFCSDEYLLAINQTHLSHDFYTDIITFDLSSTEGNIEGEIYISVDRVRENAKSLGQLLHHEILRVIFHGALHLCGYKDKTKAQVSEMRSREDYYIKLFLKSLR